jgi:hypothetical protein
VNLLCEFPSWADPETGPVETIQEQSFFYAGEKKVDTRCPEVSKGAPGVKSRNPRTTICFTAPEPRDRNGRSLRNYPHQQRPLGWY